MQVLTPVQVARMTVRAWPVTPDVFSLGSIAFAQVSGSHSTDVTGTTDESSALINLQPFALQFPSLQDSFDGLRRAVTDQLKASEQADSRGRSPAMRGFPHGAILQAPAEGRPSRCISILQQSAAAGQGSHARPTLRGFELDGPPATVFTQGGISQQAPTSWRTGPSSGPDESELGPPAPTPGPNRQPEFPSQSVFSQQAATSWQDGQIPLRGVDWQAPTPGLNPQPMYPTHQEFRQPACPTPSVVGLHAPTRTSEWVDSQPAGSSQTAWTHEQRSTLRPAYPTQSPSGQPAGLHSLEGQSTPFLWNAAGQHAPTFAQSFQSTQSGAGIHAPVRKDPSQSGSESGLEQLQRLQQTPSLGHLPLFQGTPTGVDHFEALGDLLRLAPTSSGNLEVNPKPWPQKGLGSPLVLPLDWQPSAPDILASPPAWPACSPSGLTHCNESGGSKHTRQQPQQLHSTAGDSFPEPLLGPKGQSIAARDSSSAAQSDEFYLPELPSSADGWPHT